MQPSISPPQHVFELESEAASGLELILATDLDGTLLAGSDEQRSRLRELLVSLGERALLIFVTGRSLETTRPLLFDPLVPAPGFVIGDVGASVVGLPSLSPVQPLQAEIEANWPGAAAVEQALANFPQLVRQSVPQERRCSYLVESAEVVTPALEDAVRSLGCELIVSCDRYVDVLPGGVSKGETLRALIDCLGLPSERLVVSGDTLNDASLFDLPCPGIIVGGAEPALTARFADQQRVVVSSEPGAAGILDGLRRLGRINGAELAAEPPAVLAPAGQAQLVIVYHRLPFDEHRRGKKTIRRKPKSPNGVIPSLLGFFGAGRDGRWVAWSMQGTREPEGFVADVPVDEKRFPSLSASRIPLTREDVNLFYKRFSKEAFWPIIFSFPERATFDHQHWRHYLEVNRIFAERTAAIAEPGAQVWIHDYNLWMVPAFLRQLRADVSIAFFHHTAFPAPDIFNIIPWRREILGSLICCDYIGFHVPRYVENFADALRAFAPSETLGSVDCAPRFLSYGCALGAHRMTTSMRIEGRVVRMGAHPIGVDVERIEQLVEGARLRERIVSIRSDLGSRRRVLSVERLDYVKGPLEKLAAFELLLDEHPDLRGQVELLNVITPPAPGMEAYRSLRGRVDEAVGRINGRFGTLDWTPVHYFYRSLPFDEVVAHYATADVAWITPLRDGLNLVAKEFVIANSAVDGHGALVLSEFAGASVELHGAILTNPFDIRRMSDDLYRALQLPRAERDESLRRMAAIIRENDVQRWGDEFLGAVAG